MVLFFMYVWEMHNKHVDSLHFLEITQGNLHQCETTLKTTVIIVWTERTRSGQPHCDEYKVFRQASQQLHRGMKSILLRQTGTRCTVS